MTMHSILNGRKALAAASILTLAGGLMAVQARADQWDRKTILKVGQTIQVEDTVLPPGTYVLKLYNSLSERHVVQIFNEDQSQIIDTVLARPKERLQATGKSEFTFWETPAGTARAMRAWFYPGDLIGQEFGYPHHPKQLAMSTTTTSSVATSAPSPSTATDTSTANTASTEPAPMTSNEYAPAPAEAAASSEAASADRSSEPEQQSVEVAQNNAPDTMTTRDRSSDNQLPKTGSPYPLIGLSGMVMLGLSGLLRIKQNA